MKPEIATNRLEIVEEPLPVDALATAETSALGGYFETDTHVNYMGVSLEKRSDATAVPQRERFEGHVITDYEKRLQQKIAVSFDLAQPALIEGGSGIGKTSTVERMSAELGWNCFYANCHEYDSDTLFGMPGEKAGEYTNGIITQWLEDGGVMLLDEYNFMNHKIRGRLHEVLDAVLNGKEAITVTEQDGRRVAVNPNCRIVGLQNAPGGRNFGREELDEPQLTRYVYIKLEDELPKDIREARALGAVGGSVPTALAEEEFLKINPDFSRKDLAKVPGIQELMLVFEEFDQTVSAMIERSELGKDSPQPLYTSFSRDLQRVLDFMVRYYTGNPEETLHKALEFYYLGRLNSQSDKSTVQELISGVTLVTEDDPYRNSLEVDTPTRTASDKSQGNLIAGNQQIGSMANTPVTVYHYLLKRGFGTDDALAALCGDASPAAFAIRDDAFKQGASLEAIVKSLPGVSHTLADAWRKRAIEEGVPAGSILTSLAGVEETEISRAELAKQILDVRTSNYDKKDQMNGLILSITGRDDDEANQIRGMILSPRNWLARSIRSRFWPTEPEMWLVGERGGERLPFGILATALSPIVLPIAALDQKGMAEGQVLQSLAGLNTDSAMAFRKRFVGKQSRAADLAVSLAGLSDSEAWSIRNAILDNLRDGDKMISVALVDSEKADQIRAVRILEQEVWSHKQYPRCLAELDTPAAADRRAEALGKVNRRDAQVHRNPFTVAVKTALNRSSRAVSPLATSPEISSARESSD